MFDTYQANTSQTIRLERERELWIKQMKMGKNRYVFFHTVVFGNVIFVLLRGVNFLFKLYVHPFDFKGKVVVAAVEMFLSMWAGYRIGLQFWRRGVRITSATGATELIGGIIVG
ncbi:MAG: hypothetical protein ABR889_07725 [Acidobacteriaceae bacterium]|jgi:hypothetical protein